MLTPRSAVQRTAVVTVTLATAAGLAVAGSSSAAADPPHLNVDSCAQLLARAAAWPGESSDGSHRVSDAYVSYLLRQPACTSED